MSGALSDADEPCDELAFARRIAEMSKCPPLTFCESLSAYHHTIDLCIRSLQDFAVCIPVEVDTVHLKSQVYDWPVSLCLSSNHVCAH